MYLCVCVSYEGSEVGQPDLRRVCEKTRAPTHLAYKPLHECGELHGVGQRERQDVGRDGRVHGHCEQAGAEERDGGDGIEPVADPPARRIRGAEREGEDGERLDTRRGLASKGEHTFSSTRSQPTSRWQ